MNVFFVSGFKKICFSNIIYRKNGKRWGCYYNMINVLFKNLYVVFEKV